MQNSHGHYVFLRISAPVASIKSSGECIVCFFLLSLYLFLLLFFPLCVFCILCLCDKPNCCIYVGLPSLSVLKVFILFGKNGKYDIRRDIILTLISGCESEYKGIVRATASLHPYNTAHSLCHILYFQLYICEYILIYVFMAFTIEANENHIRGLFPAVWSLLDLKAPMQSPHQQFGMFQRDLARKSLVKRERFN